MKPPGDVTDTIRALFYSLWSSVSSTIRHTCTSNQTQAVLWHRSTSIRASVYIQQPTRLSHPKYLCYLVSWWVVLFTQGQMATHNNTLNSNSSHLPVCICCPTVVQSSDTCRCRIGSSCAAWYLTTLLHHHRLFIKGLIVSKMWPPTSGNTQSEAQHVQLNPRFA